VHGQASFLLDYADTLLDAADVTAAEILMQEPEWPRDTPCAQATSGRAAMLSGRTQEAEALFHNAWKGDCRTPEAARWLGSNALAAGDAAAAVRLLEDVGVHWQAQADLGALLARAYVAAELYEQGDRLAQAQSARARGRSVGQRRHSAQARS
jgi:hypothetical protein